MIKKYNTALDISEDKDKTVISVFDDGNIIGCFDATSMKDKEIKRKITAIINENIVPKI